MMIDKAIEVMKDELEKKKTGKKICECFCEKCNAFYKCDELIEAYEYVISILEEEKISAREVMKMIERDINKLARIDI